MKILHAANESAPHSPIHVLSSVNGRIVEGRFVIPFGMHPVEIVNEGGKHEKVVQRLNAATSTGLIVAFNSLLSRFARFISGPNIYQGHPDQKNDPNPAAWAPLGKVVRMDAGDNALVIHGDLPDASKALLAANTALAPSPYWGLRRTAETHEGMAVCDPVVFFSLGITPRPNIAGAAANSLDAETGRVGDKETVAPAAANEAPANFGAPIGGAAANEAPAPVAPTATNEVPVNVGAATESPAQDAPKHRDMALLAANIADMESSLTAAGLSIDSLKAQLAALTATLAERDLAIAAQKTDIINLRSELDATRTALTASKTKSDSHIMDSCNALADAAIAAKLIVPADREFWSKKLVEMPAAANELLNPERILKSKSVVTSERLAAANSALGGVPATVRFTQIVRERMAKTHEQWSEAFNACRKSHEEIYNLMPNGGRG
jgi:hypothetical protein